MEQCFHMFPISAAPYLFLVTSSGLIRWLCLKNWCRKYKWNSEQRHQQLVPLGGLMFWLGMPNMKTWTDSETCMAYHGIPNFWGLGLFAKKWIQHDTAYRVLVIYYGYAFFNWQNNARVVAKSCTVQGRTCFFCTHVFAELWDLERIHSLSNRQIVLLLSPTLTPIGTWPWLKSVA